MIRGSDSAARVVKLVDTGDLKSPDHCDRAGSIPASVTIKIMINIVKIYIYPKQILVRERAGDLVHTQCTW